MSIAALLSLSLVFAQAEPKPLLFEGTGTHARTVSTSSADAQRWFNQGLAFLFAFNHDEAIRSFEEAARIDPNCAMAHWGVATALGPHINNPAVEPAAAARAWRSLQRAREALGSRTGVERDLIEAQFKRFSADPNAERAPLDKAYAEAMKAVWRKHPRDADIGALTAEALMDLHPWDFWTPDGKPKSWTPEIKGLLERVLELDPHHPLGLHLYIHITEASANPEDGLEAARRLWKLQPGLGHMVHMPSHTFVRTGHWEDAIRSNADAIAADDAYVARRPEQGFYLVYMAHNHQMLAYAAMMVGKSKEGIAGMDHIQEAVAPEVLESMAPVLDGYLAAMYEARIRFGKWDDILSMPEPKEVFPIMRAIRHMARAVAFAVKGDAKSARIEQWHFYRTRNFVPKDRGIGNNTAWDVMKVAELLMNGEILLGENRIEDAIKTLRTAVRAEDGLKYNEPPDWLQPTRHALGAVLVKARHFKEAEAVYREDLKRLPNNGWSTFGMIQALKGQGKDAKQYEDAFEEIWAASDIPINSSCLCVPSK